MEMGFDEKEVIDALRVNNNQQDAAVGSPSAQLLAGSLAVLTTPTGDDGVQG